MTTNVQPATSLKTAVDQIRDRHIAAVNDGDVEAATSIFAPSAVFLPPGQPALEGTSAIRAWFTYVFANFRLQSFDIQPGVVEEHGGIAIEHGSWQGTFEPKNGSPSMTAGGTYLTVYARSGEGNVRVIRDTFNGMPG